MNQDGLQRRGVRRAFFALLWMGAASSMGCTKCSPSGRLGARDAGPPAADTCASMPAAPQLKPDAPTVCRYWVVDDPASACASFDASNGKFWRGTPVFPEAQSAALKKYCHYEWSDEAGDPTAADVNVLPNKRSPDCTYITPQQAAPDAFTQWARDELLPPMTDRLPASGAPANLDVNVRVVVLDTAPTAVNDSHEGQHGRTLAHLIRESACQKPDADPADCPVEVTSQLAMPRTINAQTKKPEWSPYGGTFGLLSDVAGAIWLETNRYRFNIEGQVNDPSRRRAVPARVIFNESFGFGNTDELKNRCADAPAADDVTTAALFDAFMASACLGVLHVAAAGNHSGGSSHLDGMLCPARWDHAVIPTDKACSALWGKNVWEGDAKTPGLKDKFAEFSAAKNSGARFPMFSAAVEGNRTADALLSVGGVDYHGSPIVLTRPKACPEAVAIGIGGIGLGGKEGVPPFLFGTSVSAAVASARLAILWARNPTPTAATIQLSNGSRPTPFVREAGLCGGDVINCANQIPWIGRPPSTIGGQNAPFPIGTPTPLWLPAGQRTTQTISPVVCETQVPHCVLPSRAATSDVWPQPTDPVCIKCGIFIPRNSGDPELWINPNLPFAGTLSSPILVLADQRGAVTLTWPLRGIPLNTSTQTVLSGLSPTALVGASVWLSAYDSAGRSYSQQIFVDQ